MDCKNCGKVFYDDYKFCPDCGQDKREKLTIGLLFRNTFGNYLSVDSRILKSIIPILFKPGKLTKTFNSGQRQKYLHPARFYLFATLVFFFLFSFDSDDNEKSDSEFEAAASEIQNEISHALFFMLPMFAVFIKLFYRRSASFAECMVFSFYNFTFVFIIFILLLIINYLFANPTIVNVVMAIYGFVYFFIGLKKIFDQSIIKTIVKGLMIQFLYSLLILPITFVILLLSTFLLYS